MSEKQIEVKIITETPETTFLRALASVLDATKDMEPEKKLKVLAGVKIARDCFDEYKLQNNSIVL